MGKRWENYALYMNERYFTDENRKMFFFLLMMTILSSVGLQGWRTLLNNFGVEVVGVTGLEIGVIQGIREVPGFLALLVIYVLLVVKEHRVSALSLVVMGLGIWMTGLLPSFHGLVATTFLMSLGFHYAMTLTQSLTLQYFDTVKAPLVLTKMRAVSAAANVIAGALIFGISYFMSYAQIFSLFGGAITLIALIYTFKDPTSKNIVPQRKKMLLRKRYWLFYALTFMSGARRQIFVAFAVFLLVKKFGFSVREITILFMVNNVINYFINPMIGRAINRFGERKVLSAEYLSLIAIFIVYAYTDSKLVVTVMYILDFIFFNFAVAIKSHFQKIADPRDIAPTMAMGVTINHIAAVIIPIIGGVIWMMDYKIPFLAGAVLSVISLVLVQFIRRKEVVVSPLERPPINDI